MPGTILVSVLEFLGLPYPSSPSSISIKVSMGNKEYQTWDKGDFSFPLTTLRETLVVVVQDSEGNEISHGGVETKSIVERGLWDDIFNLEGGGQVRMKLQFVLNEDEKNRIRKMRESALKRKQARAISLRTNSVEVADNDGNKFASSIFPENADKNEDRTSSVVPSGQKVDTQPSKVGPQEPARRVEVQPLSAPAPSKVVHSRQSPPSIKSAESGASSRKRPSLERNPSSVKRMISAFESNLPQDARPQIKPRLETQQVNKIGLYSKETETERKEPVQGTGQLEESSTKKIKGKVIDIEPKVLRKVDNKPREELKRKSSIETISASENGLHQHEQQSDYLSGAEKDSGGSLVVEESRADILSESSKFSIVRRASIHESRTTDYHEDMLDRSEISGAWIFPDQQRLFCVTTGGKKVMDFMGVHGVNSETHREKTIICVPQKIRHENSTQNEVERTEKTLGSKTPKPHSDGAEPSTGLFGKVVKVAIMVGFGVLVLFTRQRNSR